MKQLKPIRLLLIEDDKADVILAKKAFGASTIRYDIAHAKDGEVAVDMLTKSGSYADFVLPNLILLDLNMPKKDGRTFIKDISAQKHVKHIPIIILSGSREEAEALYNEADNVNGYILKANSQAEYGAIVKEIEDIITGTINA